VKGEETLSNAEDTPTTDSITGKCRSVRGHLLKGTVERCLASERSKPDKNGNAGTPDQIEIGV
jgi:hypothetical protein